MVMAWGGHLVAEVPALGADHGVLEDRLLAFLLAGAAAADEHADRFLEVEQPERQQPRLDVDDLGHVGERARILVVRVDQHDVALGLLRQHGAQDQGYRAALARARGAQHGHVLAEQRVGHQIGWHVLVLVDRAEAHGRRRPLCVDLTDVLAGRDRDRRARQGVDRHAAMELGLGAFVHDLAEQVDVEDAQVALAARPALDDVVLAEHGRDRRRHLDQGAHACVGQVLRARRQLDGDLGGAHCDYPPENLIWFGYRDLSIRRHEDGDRQVYTLLTRHANASADHPRAIPCA